MVRWVGFVDGESGPLRVRSSPQRATVSTSDAIVQHLLNKLASSGSAASCSALSLRPRARVPGGCVGRRAASYGRCRAGMGSPDSLVEGWVQAVVAGHVQRRVLRVGESADPLQRFLRHRREFAFVGRTSPLRKCRARDFGRATKSRGPVQFGANQQIAASDPPTTPRVPAVCPWRRTVVSSGSLETDVRELLLSDVAGRLGGRPTVRDCLALRVGIVGASCP